MKLEEKTQVSVEDLLHFKRAERPAPEFWDAFDRELRARQLAAIVHRRPWWQGFFGAVARRQVMIGAAAALLVALAGAGRLGRTLHSGEYGSSSIAYSPAIDRASIRPVVRSESPEAAASSVSGPSADSRPSGPADVRSEPQQARLSTVALTESSPLESMGPGAAGAFLNSSEHLISINLAADQIPQSDLTRLSDMATGPSAADSDSAVVRTDNPGTEPLSRIDPASEERRARLLVSALPVASIAQNGAAASSARVAQDLDEDRLNNSISRYGVGGDRFSIRF